MTRRTVAARAVPLVVLVGAALACSGPAGDGKIPITTASSKARASYFESRNMMDRLRLSEARRHAREALDEDPTFAMGHLMMANTAPTVPEFFESLARAVELSENASEGERLMILGLDAGTRGDPDTQRDLYTRLALLYPDDERAHNLLGGYYFSRQEWTRAIEHYQRATALAPDFSPPYNQLGYALRFVGRFDEAERAFREYIRLIPDEPNPYDSYAELLMKRGKFEESIRNYEKALEREPGFAPSYVGIGWNRLLLGDPEAALETFARLEEVAATDAERRQARLWTAMSLVHERRHDEALEVVRAMHDLAEQAGDRATMARDLILAGDVLLAAGRFDEALRRYHRAVEISDASDSPDEVKRAVRRNILYNEARVALARGDLDQAKTITNRYGDLVGAFRIPSERRLHRELVGVITLAEDDFASALEHLRAADQQDPRVLYEIALAYEGLGDRASARETAAEAAHWNGLAVNFAFVRHRARELLDRL